MNVIYGTFSPLLQVYSNGSPSTSESSYYDYLLNHLSPVGAISGTFLVGNTQLGFTNDGLFYIEQNWVEGEPIVSIQPILDLIQKQFTIPLQMIPYSNKGYRQIDPSHLRRGIIQNGILENCSIGVGVIDTGRHTLRSDLETFISLKKMPNTSQKTYLGIHYPMYSFLDFQVFAAARLKCVELYSQHPQIRFDLLSLFLSHSADANLRQAFFYGALFLENICGVMIDRYNQNWLLNKPRATLGDKLAYMRDKTLIADVAFNGLSKRIKNKRNDVFHKGVLVDIGDLQSLRETIDLVLMQCAGLDLDQKFLIRFKTL